MKKILLISSLFSVLVFASEPIETNTIHENYFPEEINILKKNGMSSLDLEKIKNKNMDFSKEGLIIFKKSRIEMNIVNEKISSDIILSLKELEIPLSNIEKLKRIILKDNKSITLKNLDKFIKFNFIGKISFSIERDIMFKDIKPSPEFNKNKITKKEILMVIEKEMKTKLKFEEEILASFDIRGYDSVINNYDNIIKSISSNFTKEEFEFINKEIESKLEK